MSYEPEGEYALYKEVSVCAIKEHRCSACSEVIARGNQYVRVNIVWDGTAKTIKRCGRCQKLHNHLRYIGDGNFWPDEQLSCGQDYEEEWGSPPPEEIAALAFMTTQEANQLFTNGEQLT